MFFLFVFFRKATIQFISVRDICFTSLFRIHSFQHWMAREVVNVTKCQGFHQPRHGEYTSVKKRFSLVFWANEAILNKCCPSVYKPLRKIIKGCAKVLELLCCIHTYTISKRIELESPSGSDFEADLSSFKTRATGTIELNSFRNYVSINTTQHSNANTFANR